MNNPTAYMDDAKRIGIDGKQYLLIDVGGFTGLYVPDGLSAWRRARKTDLPPNASYNLFQCWDLQVYSDEYNQWVNIVAFEPATGNNA